jgi:hypothetical protein
VPVVATWARAPLRRVAEAGARADASTISRLSLSALFNTWYYLGMASALGGRAAFRRTIVRRSGRSGG